MSSPIYEAVKAALIERGWKIVPDPKVNEKGDREEFVHENCQRPYDWIDATLVQHVLFEGN